MKRVHWWTVLGVSGTGLAAMLLGQTVLGQPESKQPAAPPIVIPQGESLPSKNADERLAPEPASGHLPMLQPMIPMESTLPLLTPPPTKPEAPTGGQLPPGFGVQAPAPLLPVKADQANSLLPGANADKPAAGSISLEVPPGRQQPAISIEWEAPASIRVNYPMKTQIVVKNTSNTPAQNVIVRHRLGQGVTCKSTEPKAEPEGGELVWNLGTLAPSQSRRIDLVLVSQTRGPLACPATVTFTGVANHQVQVQEPKLLAKVSGPDKIVIGENVSLLFHISNPGDGITEAVKLKATLPDGLEHGRGKIVEFEVGSLAPKELRTLQLVCLAKGSGVQKCNLVVTGDGGLISSDAAQVEVLMPKLDVVMSGPKLRYLDRHAIYVVKVTNPGNAPALGVEVLELIPTGFKFHQANLNAKFDEATRLVTWSVGDLQPGQSKDLAVDLIPVESGEHRLTVLAKGARGLKAEADARTLVEGLPSLFIEVGQVDDPLEVGAETSFDIRLANNGTKAETNVEVVCTLPEQLEFRGAKCSATLRFRQEGRDLIFEPLSKLAPKADVIYKVQVRGVAAGDVRFRTRIKADGLKEPVTREESTRIYNDEGPMRPATGNTSAPTKTPNVNVPAPTSKPSDLTPSPLPFPTPKSGDTLPMPGPAIPAPTQSSPAPSPVAPPAPTATPSTLPPLPSLPGTSVPVPQPNR